METKKENVKEVSKHPYFITCSEHATNSFWKNVLEEMGKGKSPRSIYVCDSTIFCSDKSINNSYTFEKEKSPKISCEEIIKFLQTNTCLCSEEEEAEKKQISRQRKKGEEVVQSWSQIKKKHIKELLIMDYVILKMKQHHLTVEEGINFLKMIRLSLIYRIHSSKDIEYKNEKIENIHGFVWNEKKKCFMNQKLVLSKIPKEQKEIVQKNLSDRWITYITCRLRMLR